MRERRRPAAYASARQLAMALDAPRPLGMSAEERRAAVTALASLLAEAAAGGGGDDGR